MLPTDDKIIFKQESYQLIKLAFDVFNSLGFCYQEKYYQCAFAQELTVNKIKFCKEQPSIISYKGKIVGRYFIDFVINNQIVVEFKVANEFYLKHQNQVLAYLRATNLKLGIIILVTKEGIKFKRLVN